MELNAAGTTIHCELAGDGPVRVLLLHGWGCSTALMKPVADALCGACRVLSIDFPGFGQSGRPPEPWDVPAYAVATLDVLRQTDFLPCAVVAHSFGGRVAALLAAEDASLFTRLILTGAAGIKKPSTPESERRSAQFRRLKGLCEGAKRLKIFGPLPDRAEDALRRRYGSADYNALDAEMRKTFVKVISQDLSACYPRIRQPVLLVWGDRDTETPLWMGQRMEKLIPDAGLVVLEGGGHFAYLEQAARFTTIARHFLTEE